MYECRANGQECVATRTPTAEVCGDQRDNDCNGVVDNGCLSDDAGPGRDGAPVDAGSGAGDARGGGGDASGGSIPDAAGGGGGGTGSRELGGCSGCRTVGGRTNDDGSEAFAQRYEQVQQEGPVWE